MGLMRGTSPKQRPPYALPRHRALGLSQQHAQLKLTCRPIEMKPDDRQTRWRRTSWRPSDYNQLQILYPTLLRFNIGRVSPLAPDASSTYLDMLSTEIAPIITRLRIAAQKCLLKLHDAECHSDTGLGNI